MPCLQKLTEECPGGDDNGLRIGEAVPVNVICVHDNLKGVLCAGLPLKMLKVAGKARVAILGFHEKPGFAVSHDNEIDLTLRLVAARKERPFDGRT